MHGLTVKKALLSTALVAAGMAAQAGDDLVINGFLSVGGGASDNSDVSFNGYDQDVGFAPDTVLGVQLSKRLDEKVSMTGQLVSKGQPLVTTSGPYDTTVEWAFATINATDDIDIRAGRLRAPFYYYSDFLDVGYAYNWIRPPSEVYRLNVFSSVDGIDLTYRYSMGNWDSSVQAYYGEWRGTTTFGAIELNNFAGAVYNISNDWINLRASYHRADVTAAAVGVVDQVGEFIEVASVFDMDDMQIIAEWTTTIQEGRSAFLDDEAWLVSLAKRMDDKTIHLTYATEKDSVKSGQADTRSERYSVILGGRYDFASSTALKAEVQYKDEDKVSGAPGSDGMLYTVAIDMVF